MVLKLGIGADLLCPCGGLFCDRGHTLHGVYNRLLLQLRMRRLLTDILDLFMDQLHRFANQLKGIQSFPDLLMLRMDRFLSRSHVVPGISYLFLQRTDPLMDE